MTYRCCLCLTKSIFFNSSFLGVGYIQTKDRIVDILKASPCLLLFSIGVYMFLNYSLMIGNCKVMRYSVSSYFFRNRKLRHFNYRCCAMNTLYLLELLFSFFLYLFLHLSDQQEGTV